MKKFNTQFIIYTILLLTTIISAYPLYKYAHIIGILIWILLYFITMITALTIEKFKKRYDIQTYKEIINFFESKTLSHDEKIEEIAKRPYQKFLLGLCSAIITI